MAWCKLDIYYLGCINGFYLVFALITKDFRERFNKLFHFDKVPILSVLSTFILVAFAWIFFRANGVHSAILYCKAYIYRYT